MGRSLALNYGMRFAEVSAEAGTSVRRVIDAFMLEIVSEKVGGALPWKDIYMTFLLYLNEDFDDDLLQDATELLTGEQ